MGCWPRRTPIETGLGIRPEGGELHPLVVIANKQLHQIRPASGVEPGVADRVAGRQGRTPVSAHPDPLKLDIAAVRRLLPFVSYEYAARYQILPVAVDATRWSATTEPYLTEWQDILRQTLRKEIERVIASPLDINRYQMEFYGVSRSVRGAMQIAGTGFRYPQFRAVTGTGPAR